MNEAPSPVVLMGPENVGRRLLEVLAELEVEGPVALVTAGWQEREREDVPLQKHLGGRALNLALHRRFEESAREDPELREAHRTFQDGLKLLRRAYNLRLSHLMEAWIRLEEMEGDPGILEPERQAALEDVRNLDRDHLDRVRELRAGFDAEHRPGERASVARHREEVRDLLQGARAVAVAGGHVAVLLNRLRIFGVREMLRDKLLVAWAGGAMALSQRVVLFHDDPPWGPGHAEAFEEGLGLIPDLVPLPRASERLRLGDPLRVGRFARRFGPSPCVVLDGTDRIQRLRDHWEVRAGGRRLGEDGHLRELAP